MKIVLVRTLNKFTYSFVPPLGLGYLASSLKAGGRNEVLLYDAVKLGDPSPESFGKFIAMHRPRMAGIQVYSVDLPEVREFLRAAKQGSPDIMTILGGPHPSACPEETLRHFGPELADFAFVGEGELGLPALAGSLERDDGAWKEIQGLAWRDKEGGGIRTNGRAVIQDLDSIQHPDWELLDPAGYPHAPLGGFSMNFPVAPIIVSRGCPMDCSFCAAKTIYGKGFRRRSIDDVIAEIKYLQARGMKEIMILDDNIAFNKDLVLELCGKIKPLGIPWNCLNGIRVDFIDDEVAAAMKGSGCYAAGVGIESGSQKILGDMNKKTTLEMIERKVAVLSGHGIRVTGFFILGYPTETREDILATIRFSLKLKLDQAAFANFLPLPGSPIFEKLRSEGRLDGPDFAGMSYYKATRSFTPHLSADELDALLKQAVRSFYMRPLVMLRTLPRVGSFSNLLHLVKRFLRNYVS